ncbi:Na+/H+ antiporter NhaC family protein [Halospeciosus flavus]|uniref:Na+/H+ antiporter NhaC family protein n=1 Tax=Halospeciosus flavus TaxID=3032283 RepID=A0ABD5Z660_9EURY|nr:Na+/H+ antiporter NhaC family protein [Halospeciosus flavus]
MATFGALSVVPPLVAIIAAVVTRRAIPGLFIGAWVGGIIYTGGHGLGITFHWIIESVATTFHVSLLLFIFLLGAGIGFMWKLGGSLAVRDYAAARLQNRRQAGIVAWLLGLAVFFNDYANTAIVGTAMQDVTDSLGISREKLSYIVDSTSAPVATFMFSDWIAFQLSMIREGYKAAGITETAPSAFVVFLQSIPFNFYCLLAIVMVGIIVISGRDFGEMKAAEERTLSTGEVMWPDAQPMQSVEGDLGEPRTSKPMLRVFIAPIVMLVALTLVGVYWTGRSGGDLVGILGSANWALSLVWGGAGMVATAAYYGLRHEILTFDETVTTFVDGMKIMMTAGTILVLAWTIGTVTTELGTGDYVTQLAGDFVSPALLLVVIAVTAAFISFTTGTSWGTMAVLTPIAVPLGVNVVGMSVLGPVIGAVFSGAIFGDHCSPISDTTVLSSTFTGADHIDHVRTQIYYAVTVFLVAAVLYLAWGFLAITPYILLPLGVLALVALVYGLSSLDFSIGVAQRGE